MSIIAKPCYPKANLYLNSWNGSIRIKLYKDSKWSYDENNSGITVWKGITYIHLSYHDFFCLFYSDEQIYKNIWDRCSRNGLLEPSMSFLDPLKDYFIAEMGGIKK